MADLRGFSKNINLRADQLITNTDDLIRKIALAVDQGVVTQTPVDTGRAKSNWIVRIGEPSSDQVPPHNPGSSGSSSRANEAQALMLGAMEIEKYQNGDTINITNNLPYITKLNDGHSLQAPSGFVQQAMLSAVQQVIRANIVGD